MDQNECFWEFFFMIFYNIWVFVVNLFVLNEMIKVEFDNWEYFEMFDLMIKKLDMIILNINYLLNFEKEIN